MSYRTAEALVTEYTTSISKGGCALVSERALEIGTNFVFEMYAEGQEDPLEIEGVVVRVERIEAMVPRFEIGVEYTSTGTRREVVDRILAGILIDSSYEALRRHPRIPVNLVARDPLLPRRYLLRDLSRGGMRIEAKGVSSDVEVGVNALLAVQLPEHQDPISFTGRVVWLQRGSLLLRTRLGVQFAPLDEMRQLVVDGLTSLLRPQSLSLEFRPDSSQPEELTKTQRMPKFAPTFDESRAFVQDFAVAFLFEQSFLPLELTDDAPWPQNEGVFARVGIVGDVEGELMVQVEETIALQIAHEILGEIAVVSDHILLDALTEWVTAMAGFVCDKLDEVNVELEVSAPLVGDPILGTRDHTSYVVLRGRDGGVAVTIVARDPSTSVWPI